MNYWVKPVTAMRKRYLVGAAAVLQQKNILTRTIDARFMPRKVGHG